MKYSLVKGRHIVSKMATFGKRRKGLFTFSIGTYNEVNTCQYLVAVQPSLIQERRTLVCFHLPQWE